MTIQPWADPDKILPDTEDVYCVLVKEHNKVYRRLAEFKFTNADKWEGVFIDTCSLVEVHPIKWTPYPQV
jgi:hypothetical protein